MKAFKLIGFYALQWTWGILMNIVGLFVFLFYLICGGCKVYTKYGRVICETRMLQWCGASCGMFIFIGRWCDNLIPHECGHSLQNIIWGPLFPFVIAIPSAIRFQYRQIVKNKGKGDTLPPYDSVWFESQATHFGELYYNN